MHVKLSTHPIPITADLLSQMEWRREEEERLVDLARLPALVDWRAVAAEVGRTPAQCKERYEELLDVACARDERHDPRDDLRRLRAGEVGPDAEDGRTPPA